jgi:tRNA-dihydrouridine synthase
MSFLDELPKPFLVLAPMDDVTDTVFRQIIADLAPPDLYLTEFVNVDGLQSPGRLKLLHKLQFTPKQRPIIAQIWGLNPDNFYKTTIELIEMGFAGVDINMGCPVKTVIKNGACAALINNRELANEIIEAAQEAARSTSSGQAGDACPISIKTRVGFTTPDLSWLEFLLTKKLDLLSIHGRTAKELSNVAANWPFIGEIRKIRDATCPSTKIVGNGDVLNRRQALELAQKYKLDGVMIGRGVFNDPFVFEEKSPWSNYSRQQKIDLYKKHIELFAQTWQKGERRIETLNKFCKIYINGFAGAKEMREKLMAQKNAEDLLTALK